MLEISNITKDYVLKDQTVQALKGVNIRFRKSEFVSILGPSGCGKTTLLNIIGGLDRYTSGDLIIDGVSTKKFKDKDWDTYRNHSIGFVFQSYNLIPHQTALKNVELALSIGGVSKKERRLRAIEALKQVGLEEQINKKPNQMSGGQCQRVSIARALVNNPEIILADEPTGALDSKTSVQIMEILKEISKQRLVIMVTHNPELAETYSTRIIKMKDGEVIHDSRKVTNVERSRLLKEIEDRKQKLSAKEIKQKKKKSAMSLATSFLLSGSNLLTKKRRTFITSLACSIGIIGIAVILSVSTGMHAYVKKIEQDSMSVNYVSVSSTSLNLETSLDIEVNLPEYPENAPVYPYEKVTIFEEKEIPKEYIEYLEKNVTGDTEDKQLANCISYTRNVTFVSGVKPILTCAEIPNNPEFLEGEYTALATENGKAIPTKRDEICLIVDKYNRITTSTLQQLNIEYNQEELTALKIKDLIGKEVNLTYTDGVSKFKTYKAKIVSILRLNEDASAEWIKASMLSQAEIGFTKDLVDAINEDFPEAVNIDSLMIYPKDFDRKDQILKVLDTWNSSEIYKVYGNEKDDNGQYIADKYKVEYTDVSKLLVGMLGDLIDISTYTLVAFSGVSLIVSSIMIAIITYASVIERIKEIGIIRSLGGRKKDVANIFRTEACIIGAVSAAIALLVTVAINAIINVILTKLVGVSTIATLSWTTTLLMMVLSVGLNLIASLVPANIAAKKDPVLALRTE